MRFVTAGFNPLTLSPALWLDAADASTLFDATTGGSLVAPDGSIARWEDKSGNARHATQGTVLSRPQRKTSIQNGRDVVRFDGSNDVLTFARTDFTAFTLFAVFNRTGSNTYQSLFQAAQTSVARASCEIGVNNDINYGPVAVGSNGNATSYGKGGILSQSTPRLITARWQGGATNGAANYSLRQNGAAATLSNSAAVGVSFGTISVIGAAYSGASIVSYLGGDIAEIIVCNEHITDSRLSATERYLATKWGITI